MLEEAAALAAQDDSLFWGCAAAAAERRKNGQAVPYKGDFDSIVYQCKRDVKPLYEKIVISPKHTAISCAQLALRVGPPVSNAPMGMRAKLNDWGTFVFFAGTVSGIEEDTVFIQDKTGASVAVIVMTEAPSFRADLIEVGRSASGFGLVQKPIDTVNGFGAPTLTRAILANCIESPPEPLHFKR